MVKGHHYFGDRPEAEHACGAWAETPERHRGKTRRCFGIARQATKSETHAFSAPPPAKFNTSKPGTIAMSASSSQNYRLQI